MFTGFIYPNWDRISSMKSMSQAFLDALQQHKPLVHTRVNRKWHLHLYSMSISYCIICNYNILLPFCIILHPTLLYTYVILTCSDCKNILLISIVEYFAGLQPPAICTKCQKKSTPGKASGDFKTNFVFCSPVPVCATSEHMRCVADLFLNLGTQKARGFDVSIQR